MSSANLTSDSRCYAHRMTQAAAHVDRGEWACGHAITSGLIQCAAADGCGVRGDCTHAARRMMSIIRGLLSD